MNYPEEVQLTKLSLIPIDSEILVSQGNEKFYEFKEESIGHYPSREEAANALQNYKESNEKTFAYKIIGPEHGRGKSELVLNEEDGLYDEVWEDVESDESPEFQFVYDSDKNLISSYFYDKNKPGGERLKGEKIFQKGDKAYVMVHISVEENSHDLLVPVIVEGVYTIDYLGNKWKKILWDTDKRINELENVPEPSPLRILRQVESISNIEKDSLVFKPLVTVKCNWGEEPATPYDDAPRIDFIQL
ncbi:MAG: hypothetical protein J1F38_05135 [Muribaculaceae bacterium]|nr:hypothetical protein [Muribaculaceae bacterium]